MLLVEALLVLIDSLIVVTAIMIIPIAVGMFVYNNSDEFRLDDE
jgi:hypothetical protein